MNTSNKGRKVIEWSVNEPRGFTRCDSEEHASRVYDEAAHAMLVRTEYWVGNEADPVFIGRKSVAEK